MSVVYRCDVCGVENRKQQGLLVKSMFTLNWSTIDSTNRSRKFGGSSNFGIDLCDDCFKDKRTYKTRAYATKVMREEDGYYPELRFRVVEIEVHACPECKQVIKH